jgi:hypothetical protein
MPAGWTYILTDETYTPVAEIVNAYDRKVSIPLNRIDSASFRIRLDNPLAPNIMTASSYVKAYRDDLLTFFGPIVTAEETGAADGASIAVNCLGAGWAFTKRLVGKSAAGTTFTTTDRATIVDTLLATANAENNTGVGSAVGNTAASASTYVAGPYKMLDATITELSTGTAGFDWRVLPNENWVNGVKTSDTIGAFYARPVIGSVAPEAVFEWGGGRNNVANYTRTMNREGQANKLYHNAAPGPDAPGYPTLSTSDPASITEFHQLEDVVQADLLDPTLRSAILAAHLSVRSFPRHIVQFSPHIDPQGIGRLPNYGQHYTVGDQVRMRVEYNSEPRIDALVRVWGVAFEIDNNGVERASMVLAEE